MKTQNARFSFPKFVTTIAALALCAGAGAQSPRPETPVDRGYFDMYNHNFAGAHQEFNTWMAAHPEDPLGPEMAGARGL